MSNFLDNWKNLLTITEIIKGYIIQIYEIQLYIGRTGRRNEGNILMAHFFESILLYHPER